VFDRTKAIETILFIAERVENPTFHTISKMLYFADKIHLEEYGRLICDDRYIAMEYGPVPSSVYDIMKSNDAIFNDAFVTDGFVVQPRRKSDLDEFSQSDIKCMEQAIQEYSSYSFGELTDISHQDSAWKNAPRDREMTLESIAKMIDESGDLLEYLQDKHP